MLRRSRTAKERRREREVQTVADAAAATAAATAAAAAATAAAAAASAAATRQLAMAFRDAAWRRAHPQQWYERAQGKQLATKATRKTVCCWDAYCRGACKQQDR